MGFPRNAFVVLFVLLFGAGTAFSATQARNIASSGNGGAIVRFSPGANNVAALIDASQRRTNFSAPAKFPVEIVIAFRRDREALIDRLTIAPAARSDMANWPRRVAISVSTNSPLEGFEEIATVSLEQTADEQSVTLNRPARFVALRFLDNFGGKSLAVGELKVFEGTAPGYISVTSTSAPPETPRIAGLEDKNEPNNTAGEAKPLVFSRALAGAIDPATDEDWFTVKVPGRQASAITLNLEGRPYIRTSLALMRGGDVLKTFDPGRSAVEQADFSWVLDPGEYHLRVSEPATSIVLIWDSSSSMRGSEKNLQRAVQSFLSQVKPPDRLQLIQFSGKIEVLTTNFTSDSQELLALFKKRYKLTSGTAFFDAVQKGAELLKNVPGNRAIVVMTDGADSQSKLAYPAFWKELADNRIRLYTVGLGQQLTRFTAKMAGTPQRMLGHIALASNGKSFFTEKPEDLLNLYQNISDELHSRSAYGLGASLSRGEGRLAVTATARRTLSSGKLAPLEIIFDASGSMREKVDGKRKIEIMKQVMATTVDGLADRQSVALRVFGHRIDSQRPGARTDSELVVPLGTVDKARLRDVIANLQPRGTTPIAFSLQQLPRDFSDAVGDKQIVLVTDGREEAGGDPVAAVKELIERGFKFRLNVVGFALADRESKEQMRTIAELTGGKFYDATSAAGLRDAVEQSAVEESLSLPFEVFDGSGATLATGTTGGNPITLPEGIFTVRVAAAKPVTVQSARVVRNEISRLILTREGDEFSTRVERAEIQTKR